MPVAILLVAATCVSQTFDVNGSSSSSSQPSKKKNAQKSRPQADASMGWGSGIEVAREARAAQTALEHGDYKEATSHAQRAVNIAPQNVDLWFTLAYAARLSGQYSLSVDSYKKGLALKPNSVQGLSGLAQTYARMGRSADAQQTLEQVLAANPRSDQDLQLAGELVLSTDPKRAVGYLQRSEAVKPSARTELLLARAYDRSGDAESARNMLEHARRSAPNNPEVVRAVASYYRDTGHYDEAIKALQSLRSKDALALAELGYSYQLAGDARASARNYSAAANRAPRDINIQLSAAQAMLNAGDFAQGTALLNHSAELDPQHYRLFALRGRLDSAEHRNADAVREYEAALQHLPAEGVPEGVLYPISVRLDLAEAYRDAGDDANADRVTKDAAAQISAIDLEGPARPEFLRLRALVELAEGNAGAAEKDLQQALQIEPKNVTLLLNYANLLRRTERKQEAQKTYQQALAIDSSNAAALGALGFLSREMGDYEAARGYFLELEKKHPDDHAAYLALGDLYSETRHFDEAEESYEKAHAKSPDNPLVVSGAINAALEAHHLPVARQWISHASEAERQNPQVMRENERYLTITGDYAASADLGYKVIKELPNDREGVDYLAYDLLFLNRLDEAMKIVERYAPVLTKDRDLPLIAGHVHAGRGEREAAVQDFTRALQIDPTIAVGYMNRGYVYNDMRLASKAEQDFRKALELNPQYGEARLGLAYALVQLRRSSQALKEADLAARLLPDSESVHLVKAEAFRQRAMIAAAEGEYKKALKLNPNDVGTYILLADVQYRGHRYADSADTLRGALAMAPDNAMVMAQLARSYAKLDRSAEAMQAIATAQRTGGKDYKILLVTADALRILGHRDQAMTTYSRALESSDENRLQVRLALGQLFAEEGKAADAQQQIAMGLAEARVASVDVTSADDYLNAASILMGIHEYQLA
ncbi:MAG: tetratricopeptide repeat protein, partial [Candidatus Sulfotelmatobacter sp.]